MTYLITLLAIICLTFSPGALSIWLYAAKGVGCIKVAGRPLCEPLPNAVGMPDASFYDGKSGTANINIEFGFDAKNDAIPPMYKQNFAFTIPNGVNDFVFTPKFCIAEKDSGKALVCYNQKQVNFESSSNPYITTKWNGEAPNPPSVKGRPQSMLGTYDTNLEASNIFNDQEETGSPVWIQTPDYANNIDLAFAFPNPYPIPGNPWD